MITVDGSRTRDCIIPAGLACSVGLNRPDYFSLEYARRWRGLHDIGLCRAGSSERGGSRQTRRRRSARACESTTVDCEEVSRPCRQIGTHRALLAGQKGRLGGGGEGESAYPEWIDV